MAEVEEIKQQLQVMKESLRDLNTKALDVRDSFSNSHRLLDNAVKRLSEQKKIYKQCSAEIRTLKQSGKDTTKYEKMISEEIEPTIQDLNQRLVPLTGR